MGKYVSLGAVVLAIIGFLVYFTVGFTGDVQDNALIEPANATMTVGEMRINPHGGSNVDEDDSTPQGSKGMRARDFIVEVTNELLEGKPANTVYLIDWTFETRDENGDVQTITDAKSIVDGEDNPVIIGAEYTINRYDASQINEDGTIKDVNTPVNSTKYKWGVYVDELARTGQPLGLGGEQTGVTFNVYGNNVNMPTFVDDYDMDGVSNTEELENGTNPYGYIRHGDGEDEVDFASELDRETLGITEHVGG